MAGRVGGGGRAGGGGEVRSYFTIRKQRCGGTLRRKGELAGERAGAALGSAVVAGWAVVAELYQVVVGFVIPVLTGAGLSVCPEGHWLRVRVEGQRLRVWVFSPLEVRTADFSRFMLSRGCLWLYWLRHSVPIQGYLVHEKTPTLLGPPKDPTHIPTVGS